MWSISVWPLCKRQIAVLGLAHNGGWRAAYEYHATSQPGLHLCTGVSAPALLPLGGPAHQVLCRVVMQPRWQDAGQRVAPCGTGAVRINPLLFGLINSRRKNKMVFCVIWDAKLMLNFSRRDRRNSTRGYRLRPNQSKHVRADRALWEQHTAHNLH